MYMFYNAPLILILALFILENVSNNYLVHALFDGIEARMGDVPWQVYFRYGREYQCGGVYTEITTGSLTEHVVLTTASCLIFQGRYKNLTFRPRDLHLCGETNLFIDNADNPWAPQRDVRKVVIHQDFDPDTLQNDIGILFLKRQWTISRDITPIKLPDPDEPDPLEGIVSGWGARGGSNQLGRYLKWKWVVLPSQQFCLKQGNPPQTITNNQFCMNSFYGFTGVSTCRTDRGSPFAFYSTAEDDWRLGGIISYQRGFDCHDLSQPTILTRITPYLIWIKQVVAASQG